MLVNFAATFSGVIASFLLWFGGQWLIRHRSDKQRLTNMLKEIEDEINDNVVLLTAIACSVRQSSVKQEVSMWIPRLNLIAYQYAVSSGDIRLLNDASTRQLIRLMAWRCMQFNEFADNTEQILTIGLIMPNGLHLANHRLKMLVEQTENDKVALEKALGELREKRLGYKCRTLTSLPRT